MKIDLEQVYILESTMRLRYSPLQLRHNLKIFFIALLFVMWFQGFIMESYQEILLEKELI